MGLFDLCERKKNIFLETVKTASFYLKFNEGFHNGIFASLKKTQKEISKIINCKSEGQICDIIHGKHLLKLEQIDKIIERGNFDWKDAINNSTGFRIGQRGYLTCDRDFINFVLSERKLV